jgi:cobyrinic acid a,c-diamide synthase
MHHLLVSALHKSSGKTIVSLGLCAALSERGHRVQAFKKGPDFIDPLWLGAASGGDCHNLDFHTMAHEEIVGVFARHGSRADVSIIEGTKGLYDGVNVDGCDSNAALAKLLGSPVVLVVDTRGMTRGIAPMVRGFQAFDPEVRFAGVILNQVGGTRHESKLRAALERYTDLPVLGAVGKDPALEITQRHIGLIPASEVDTASDTVARIGRRLASQVDLDRLLATTAGEPSVSRVPARPSSMGRAGSDLRLGIARDAAFGFYYPGDLEALEAGGAELVPMDTLRDTALPEIDGLFLGGGFPEMHMGELEANAPLRAALRTAIHGGLPVYAECGGLMYLSRRIRHGDRRAEMVGVIDADALMMDRPQGRGYVVLEETGESPWCTSDEDRTGTTMNAHEFHHSRLVDCGTEFRFAYRMRRGFGVDGGHDGIVHRNVLASYAHLRDVSANRWTSRFLRFLRLERRRSPGPMVAARAGSLG